MYRVLIRLRVTCSHVLAQNVLWESIDEPLAFIMDILGKWD